MPESFGFRVERIINKAISEEVMELRGKALPILILMAILSTLVIAGCNRDEQAPRRPVTPREKTTTEDSTLTRKAQQPPTQATATEIRKLADRLTNKAVEVKGVRSATVVVQPANNRYTVLVGLTLNSEVKQDQTSAIKKEVSEKLSKTDKRINRVLVTTNPELVRRIEDIARGILGGKPVQSFAEEITEVTRRIAPTID
ncbi:MAG: YhcN/YlaJ family sporulation lipoprotein [Syntrophomonadaceae bacterium]|nr:YhcN/YlaJ family sporulation lipoprotein [Syntrophomonadaceae bacterium]